MFLSPWEVSCFLLRAVPFLWSLICGYILRLTYRWIPQESVRTRPSPLSGGITTAGSPQVKFSAWVCSNHTSCMNSNWKSRDGQFGITNSQESYFSSQPKVKVSRGSFPFRPICRMKFLAHSFLRSGCSPSGLQLWGVSWWTLLLGGARCLPPVPCTSHSQPRFILEIYHLLTFLSIQQCFFKKKKEKRVLKKYFGASG